MSVSIDSRSFLHDLRLVRARLDEFITYEGMIDGRELSWCYNMITDMIGAIEDAEVFIAATRSALRATAQDGLGSRSDYADRDSDRRDTSEGEPPF